MHLVCMHLIDQEAFVCAMCPLVRFGETVLLPKPVQHLIMLVEGLLNSERNDFVMFIEFKLFIVFIPL